MASEGSKAKGPYEELAYKIGVCGRVVRSGVGVGGVSENIKQLHTRHRQDWAAICAVHVITNPHDACLSVCQPLSRCMHAGRDVYVDIAGWHLFMRDMNAAPGFKMSAALATQLGPEVHEQ